jgi:hypothetical protein
MIVNSIGQGKGEVQGKGDVGGTTVTRAATRR